MNNYIKGYMYKEANEITIQSGDTLSRLANSHNTTVDELVSLNNIKDPNVIKAGQRLRLPGAQPAPQVTPQVTHQPQQAPPHNYRRKLAPEDLPERTSQFSPTEFTKHWESFRGDAYEDVVTRRVDGRDVEERIPTIGYGTTRYPDGTPVRMGDTISRELARDIMRKRHEIAVRDARGVIPHYDEMPSKLQTVFSDKAYQLGRGGLSGFERMRKALDARNYHDAAKEMVDSEWFGQSGRRSRHHATVMQEYADRIKRESSQP